MVKSQRKKSTSGADPLAFQRTHRGVHYAGAVGPDGVGDVADVDGVQMLIVACLLDENLSKRKQSVTRTQTLRKKTVT